MSITHVGLLTLESPDHAPAIAEGLRGLVGVVPGLLTVRAGLDLGLREGNGQLVFALDFDSPEAWAAYGAHPAHVALIDERIAPHLVSKAFVQVPGGTL